MKSLDLTKPVTTESLLKEFESRFNQTMDLSKFNEIELQDYANHVRTKIHEITQNTHFGQELKNNDYQKSQMMLDIINQEVSQRKLGEYGGDMGSSNGRPEMNGPPDVGDLLNQLSSNNSKNINLG